MRQPWSPRRKKVSIKHGRNNPYKKKELSFKEKDGKYNPGTNSEGKYGAGKIEEPHNTGNLNETIINEHKPENTQQNIQYAEEDKIQGLYIGQYKMPWSPRRNKTKGIKPSRYNPYKKTRTNAAIGKINTGHKTELKTRITKKRNNPERGEELTREGKYRLESHEWNNTTRDLNKTKNERQIIIMCKNKKDVKTHTRKKKQNYDPIIREVEQLKNNNLIETGIKNNIKRVKNITKIRDLRERTKAIQTIIRDNHENKTKLRLVKELLKKINKARDNKKPLIKKRITKRRGITNNEEDINEISKENKNKEIIDRGKVKIPEHKQVMVYRTAMNQKILARREKDPDKSVIGELSLKDNTQMTQKEEKIKRKKKRKRKDNTEHKAENREKEKEKGERKRKKKYKNWIERYEAYKTTEAKMRMFGTKNDEKNREWLEREEKHWIKKAIMSNDEFSTNWVDIIVDKEEINQSACARESTEQTLETSEGKQKKKLVYKEIKNRMVHHKLINHEKEEIIKIIKNSLKQEKIKNSKDNKYNRVKNQPTENNNNTELNDKEIATKIYLTRIIRPADNTKTDAILNRESIKKNRESIKKISINRMSLTTIQQNEDSSQSTRSYPSSESTEITNPEGNIITKLSGINMNESDTEMSKNDMTDIEINGGTICTINSALAINAIDRSINKLKNNATTEDYQKNLQRQNDLIKFMHGRLVESDKTVKNQKKEYSEVLKNGNNTLTIIPENKEINNPKDEICYPIIIKFPEDCDPEKEWENFKTKVTYTTRITNMIPKLDWKEAIILVPDIIEACSLILGLRKAHIEKHNPKLKLFDVGFKKPVNPKLILKGVDITKKKGEPASEWQNRFKMQLIADNPRLKEKEDEIKIITTIRNSVVIQTPWGIHRYIMNNTIRLYRMIVNADHFDDLHQCFTCLGFGHVGNNCKRKGFQKTRCAKCGSTGHEKRDCPNPDIKCFNCMERGIQPFDHLATSRACPRIKQAINESRKRTVEYPENMPRHYFEKTRDKPAPYRNPERELKRIMERDEIDNRTKRVTKKAKLSFEEIIEANTGYKSDEDDVEDNNNNTDDETRDSEEEEVINETETEMEKASKSRPKEGSNKRKEMDNTKEKDKTHITSEFEQPIPGTWMTVKSRDWILTSGQYKLQLDNKGNEYIEDDTGEKIYVAVDEEGRELPKKYLKKLGATIGGKFGKRSKDIENKNG